MDKNSVLQILGSIDIDIAKKYSFKKKILNLTTRISVDHHSQLEKISKTEVAAINQIVHH